AYAATAAFFPIAYGAIRAFARTDPRFVDMARAFGASDRQIDWQIKTRGSMPLLRSGLRLGIAVCFIAVILGEMLGSERGLGYMISRASSTLAMPRAFAFMVVVIVFAGVVQSLLKRLTAQAVDSEL